MSYIDNSGPAFPTSLANNDIELRFGYAGEVIAPGVASHYSGLSIRQWFMAHAPAEPQPWFEPKMPPRPSPPESQLDWNRAGIALQEWGAEKRKQRLVQWPAAWADEQLKAMKA